MVDFIMNHKDTSNYVVEYGWDRFLSMLRVIFPTYSLYSVSTCWCYDKQYICKAKGTMGDIIIGWEETIEK